MKHLFILLLLFSGSLVLAQNLDEGIQLYQNKQMTEASKTLSSIKSTDPNYGQARFYLGRIAFDQKAYDDAWDYFDEATDADPTKAEYYTWLGNTIGTVTQSASKFRQARLASKVKNAYLKAVELDPKSLQAQLGLLKFYTQAPGFMGGSWSKAEAAAKAISLIDRLEGHEALATVYLGKDEPALAEKEYLAAIEIDPSRMGTLGVFYQNQEWFDKAFGTFQKAYAQFPKDMSLLYQIGRTSALSGKKAQLGIQSLERYLTETATEEASPSHSAAKMRLGMIYEKQGNKVKAKSLYEASLQEDPEMELAKDGLKRVK